MADYIEREALLKDFRTFMAERFDKEKCVSAENCKDCERKCLWHRVVAKAPAADVEPVVRCKDCKFYNTIDWDGNVLCGCNLKSGMVDITPDGYCSYGERKGGDGNG